MPYESNTGLGVKQHYGARKLREGLIGGIETRGSQKELTVELSGYAINNNADFITGLLPVGAKVEEVIVRVTEAFVLTGTTPTILIGTDGTEVTNGFVISEAQAEAVGTYKITSFAGTWANGLAANTTVGVALGGTTPVVTDAGAMRVTVRYTKL